MRSTGYLLLLLMPLAIGAPESKTMHTYITCAVYHRMVAGAFQRRGAGLQSMMDLETEKMESWTKKARQLAHVQYGGEAEAMFLEQWRSSFADMMDQINRNYENISRLKYRYGDRCGVIPE